jgi:beta-glucosidase
MLGYQTTDGVPITTNDWLLSDVLRGEWGYTGTLITDWDNVGRMVWEQRIQPDITHAAAAAVRAGNDMIMTTPAFFEGALDAVSKGLLAEDAFDAAAARILTLKFELGLFENPRLPGTELDAVVGSAAHAELNLEITRRSLVLLENDGTLPLDRHAAAEDRRHRTARRRRADAARRLGRRFRSGRVARRAAARDDHDRARRPAGDRRLERHPRSRRRHPHARGRPPGAFFPDKQPRPPVVKACEPDAALIAEAVAAASDSDVVVAVVGDRIELVGEGRSTATLELIGGQNALIDALIATGKPVVIVLLASKPLVLPASASRRPPP